MRSLNYCIVYSAKQKNAREWGVVLVCDFEGEFGVLWWVFLRKDFSLFFSFSLYQHLNIGITAST